MDWTRKVNPVTFVSSERRINLCNLEEPSRRAGLPVLHRPGLQPGSRSGVGLRGPAALGILNIAQFGILTAADIAFDTLQSVWCL